MKKTLLLLIIGGTFVSNVFTQINSNPGSYNWSNPSAWSGGVVPTSTDVVNIVLNSSITLDAPLVHAADINILNGGGLYSNTPVNDLTINGGDLTLISFGAVLNFIGVNVVPVTINEGHLTNGGVFMSGDLDINNMAAPGFSSNAGDFFVSGTMTLTGVETFENNLVANVNSTLSIALDCSFNNFQNGSFGSINNLGSIDNQGNINVNGDLNNDGDLVSSVNNIYIDGDLNNDGDVTIIDSMDIQGDFNNTGMFTNNDGQVNIVNDFLNSGTVTGSLDGYYQIGQLSTNGPSGIINGDINVCDTSLTGPYLDVEMGTVDFNTVTFCGTSYASFDEEMVLDFLIYPNPTTNLLSIEMNESATASIYSMDGKLVQVDQLVSGINLLSVSNLQSGFYSVVIITSKGMSSEILIKQ